MLFDGNSGREDEQSFCRSFLLVKVRFVFIWVVQRTFLGRSYVREGFLNYWGIINQFGSAFFARKVCVDDEMPCLKYMSMQVWKTFS